MIKIDEKHPDVIAYRSGEKKQGELQQAYTKKKRELGEATTRYLESQRTLDDEAGELLEGGQFAFQPVTKTEIERLQREVEVFKAAITKQTQIVERLKNGFSKAVCQANRAQYLAIEKKIAKAVQELAEGNEEEERFFEELRAADVKPVGFRSTRIAAIGTFKDTQSGASFHRKEIKEFVPEAVA